MEPARSALSVAKMANEVVSKDTSSSGFALFTSFWGGLYLSVVVLEREDLKELDWKGRVVYASFIFVASIVMGVFAEVFLKEMP